MASRDEADFSVTNEGSVHLYAALTDNAIAFVDRELALEEWQMMGPGMFAIDYSLSFRLTQQLISEGFTVI